MFGTQDDALAALHPLVRPGGVLLFGTGYWQRPPTVEPRPPDSARRRTSCPTSRRWSTRCVAAGFRLLDLQTANEDEWNAFESGYLADLEEFAHDDPSAEQRRAEADEHRAGWLRGYRGVLGFAYLTLGVPSVR